MKPSRYWMLYLLTLLTLEPVEGLNLRLRNNGYEGVVIVIGDGLMEYPELIPRIKEVFTSASELLFFATHRRAFFQKITIVVPSRWDVGNAPDVPLYINQFKEHIRMDKPNGAKGIAPYVRGNTECGRPGWYMHLTPEFLHMNGTTPYGKHANAIVHEWGHLRWGLFDEYPTLYNGNEATSATVGTRINFYQSNGKWRPVTCSRLVEGNAYMGNCDPSRPCDAYLEALQPKADCNFCPTSTQRFKSGASLMAQQWIANMDSFCDEDIPSVPENLRHNSEAQNMQNKACNGQSAWEVMRQHEDFRNNDNPSRDEDLPPDHITFSIVKRSERKRVFVLDVSGSMAGDGIRNLNNAANFTIDNIIESGSWLGIVTFNSSARVAVEMTHIERQADRDAIIEKLPTHANGGTQIEAGLQKAVEMLEMMTFTTIEQTEIILISDGKSSSPYNNYVSVLVEKKIIVHTIAISNSADENMEQLANQTGGGSYTFLETVSVSLVDVLTQAILAGQTSEGASHTIFVDSYTVNKSVNGVFYIDQGMGKDTVIVVMLNSAKDVQLTLDVFGPNSVTCHKAGTTTILKLVVNGTIPAGRYEYNLTLNTNTDVAVDVSVKSNPISDMDDVIRVTSQLSGTTVDFNSDEELKLFVSVEKGGSPVIMASVRALLAADSTVTPINITLQDVGTGADVIANDGIYSAYLIKKYFTGKLPSTQGQKLRYNAKVFITGDQATYTHDVTLGSAPIPGAVKEAVYNQRTVGHFQRQTFPREIVVVNLEPGTDPTMVHDTTPPAQITDLLVTSIRNNQDEGEESLTYTLSWTAVGDDMDVGQAANYSLRMDKDIRTLRNRFNSSTVVSKTLNPPKPAGELETISVTLTLQDCNGTCYLAIRAADVSGLESVTSNVVIIDVDFSYKSIEEIEKVITGTSPTLKDDNDNFIMIISVVIAGVVFLILALGITAWCLVRRRCAKRRYKLSEAHQHGPTEIVHA